jgi:uncharacterized protein
LNRFKQSLCQTVEGFSMRFILVLVFVLLSYNSLAKSNTPSPDAGIAQNLPTQILRVVSGGKTHKFTVMMARTDAEQEVGMMWRLKVAPNHGMLFPLSSTRPAAFWMRNTLIPLDIIYIRKNGQIANIAANATPQSLRPIPSNGPVNAVLEIAGGRAAALGIKAGDSVRW